MNNKQNKICLIAEIADIAVTESLSNVVLETDINHSALRNVKTLSEFKGQFIYNLLLT